MHTNWPTHTSFESIFAPDWLQGAYTLWMLRESKFFWVICKSFIILTHILRIHRALALLQVLRLPQHVKGIPFKEGGFVYLTLWQFGVESMLVKYERGKRRLENVGDKMLRRIVWEVEMLMMLQGCLRVVLLSHNCSPGSLCSAVSASLSYCYSSAPTPAWVPVHLSWHGTCWTSHWLRCLLNCVSPLIFVWYFHVGQRERTPFLRLVITD